MFARQVSPGQQGARIDSREMNRELQTKFSAALARQRAIWAGEVQRRITAYQSSLVEALGDVCRSIEAPERQIDVQALAETIRSVVSAPIPPVKATEDVTPELSHAALGIACMESASSLSQLLGALVNACDGHFHRLALFTVRGASLQGWYATGFASCRAIREVRLPLGSQPSFCGIPVGGIPVPVDPAALGTAADELLRLGRTGPCAIVTGLMVRGKFAGVLYCDRDSALSTEHVTLVHTLTRYASKAADSMSWTQDSNSRPPGMSDATVAIARDVLRAAIAPRVAPSTNPPVAAGGATPQTPRTVDTPGEQPALEIPSTETLKGHIAARKFARLVVSEIKLYNEARVETGRREKDLYPRLKDEIERGRLAYSQRIPFSIRNTTDYFHEELVRVLADGDAAALGLA